MDRLVNIKGREYRLHYGLRSFCVYENIVGAPFDASKAINLYTLEYAMLIASNADIELTFDEFIDACDEDSNIFKTFVDLLDAESKKAAQFGESKKKVVEKR